MSKTDDTIKGLKNLIKQAEFGQHVIHQLWRFNFKYCTKQKEVFNRILEQAEKTLCGWCRGRGTVASYPCDQCHGMGEKLYDPNLKVANEVLDK